jgi:protein-S-isoprenylcysteine O-methyltransferase Ste14
MIVVIVWRVAETFCKQGSTRGQTSMQWSFYVLFALSCLIFGGTVAEFFLVPRTYHPAIAVAGVFLFLVANGVRRAAIRALGRFWSLHIEIREQHQFVHEGVYGAVRHPAYLAFILEHIAVPMVGNAWWSLVAALVLYVPMILWRITLEDRALTEKFGESYATYRRQVHALWPRWPTSRGAV